MNKNLLKTGAFLSAVAVVAAVAPEAQALSTSFDVVASSGLGTSTLESQIGTVINLALGFLGLISVVIVLLGGFKWMTSGGNEDKISGAKKLIGSGVVGLVIVLSAYAVATFVINNLVTVTGAN